MNNFLVDIQTTQITVNNQILRNYNELVENKIEKSVSEKFMSKDNHLDDVADVLVDGANPEEAVTDGVEAVTDVVEAEEAVTDGAEALANGADAVVDDVDAVVDTEKAVEAVVAKQLVAPDNKTKNVISFNIE
jgi:hypothetical protein